MHRFIRRLNAIISSDKFIIGVVVVLVIQSLWLAFSFRFPMIYDEGTHLSFIETLTHTLSPYTTHTPPNMTTQVSLFHYSMSFVYRFIGIFTENQATIVILLRIIGITMFSIGLILFARLLNLAKIPKKYIHLGLLIFVLLPITPLVAATINYDNMLFPVTVIYLMIALKILGGDVFEWKNVAQLIIVGCLASLIKYSFLPIFALSTVYILITLLLRYKTKLGSVAVHSLKKINAQDVIIYGTGLIVFTGLFSATFFANLLNYGSVRPKCVQIMAEQECLKSRVVKRNIEAKNTADMRQVLLPSRFLSDIWLGDMQKVTNWSGNSKSGGGYELKSPLPVMNELLFFGALIGGGCVLYSWRALPKTRAFYFLVTMSASLFLTVFFINIKSYYDVHLAYAIQPRYVLSLAPLVIVVMVWASAYTLRRYTYLKFFVAVLVFVLFTQGGGSITHLLRSEQSWYWQNQTIISTNEALKRLVSPLVNE